MSKMEAFGYSSITWESKQIGKPMILWDILYFILF